MGSRAIAIPDSQVQMIPDNEVQVLPQQPVQQKPSLYERMTASYNPDVEEWASKHPVLGPAARFFDAAGGAAMALPGQVAESAIHPIDTLKGMGSQVKGAYDFWTSPGASQKALSVLPEALGQGAGTVAGGEALGAAKGAAGPLAEKMATPMARMIVEHPTATKVASGVAGGAAGTLAGRMGGYAGEGFGLGGGIYGGLRVGDTLVRGMGEKLVEDAINGKIDPRTLPPRLMPAYVRELNARASAYASAGEAVDMGKLPTNLRESVAQMQEERSRQTPQLPSLVKTPEELAAEDQLARANRSLTEQMRPEAQARGMAHAAGRAGREWVPSRRGVTETTTRTSKYIPRQKGSQ